MTKITAEIIDLSTQLMTLHIQATLRTNRIFLSRYHGCAFNPLSNSQRVDHETQPNRQCRPQYHDLIPII
ncbi:MAG: hypothetical protein HQL77_01350 [Magnetococcales bacterium]|nr:hypothetical protein [Magnetococcales bacterium]